MHSGYQTGAVFIRRFYIGERAVNRQGVFIRADFSFAPCFTGNNADYLKLRLSLHAFANETVECNCISIERFNLRI